MTTGKMWQIVSAGALLTISAACSAASPQAAATQVSGAVATTATQSAPTVSALATQIAPNVSAAGTQLAPAISTAAAQLAPAIATISAEPVAITSGTVSASDATLTLRNNGATALDLTGWTIQAGGTTAQLPGTARLAAGQTLTLHTASGTSTATDVYLGDSAKSLSQALRPGAAVELRDAKGAVVSHFMLPSA